MSSKNVLTYLYIRGGKEKLFLILENALYKKKQTKGLVSKAQPQSIENEFCFFNFVESKVVKKPKNFLYQQLIDSLQGRGLKERLGNSQKTVQIQKFQDNIRKFQILHKKIVEKRQLKPQKQIISAKEVKSILVIKQCLSFFTNIFQDKEIDLIINDNAGHIQNLKRKRKLKQQQSQQIHFLLFNFIDKLKISLQMAELKSAFFRNNQIAKPIMQNKSDVIYNKVNLLISEFIQNHVLKFLQSMKLNELFRKSNKILKSWDASALLKEEADMISKKVTGRLLYSVEQDSNKLKKELRKQNTQRQYYIRQKKQNFHVNNNSKPVKMIQFDNEVNQITKLEVLQRQKPRNSSPKHTRNFQIQQFQFEKPKSKTQLITRQCPDRKVAQNQSFDKKSQYNYQKYYMSNLSQLKSLPKKLTNKSSHFSQRQQLKKFSPIKTSSFDQFAYNPNNQNNRTNGIKPATNTTYTNLKLFKYPIKIECFEIFSAKNSNLCYNVQQYTLKELPLKFIKDRIKFKENKVKIQYPYNMSGEQQIKVAKSLQILSCLGAEVTCQLESCYKYWNQIDEVQIMSVSWLLQMPVTDVLQCYANFFCANQTKK